MTMPADDLVVPATGPILAKAVRPEPPRSGAEADPTLHAKFAPKAAFG